MPDKLKPEDVYKLKKSYIGAGGDPDFVILSRKDHDRNWVEARRQVELSLINKIEGLLTSFFGDGLTDELYLKVLAELNKIKEEICQ